MPAFLEKKLEAEYGKGDPRVYATMNAIGAMRGNKTTAKGEAMQANTPSRRLIWATNLTIVEFLASSTIRMSFNIYSAHIPY